MRCLLLLFVLFTCSLAAQTNQADSLRSIETWLDSTDLNLDVPVQRFCTSITGKYVPIDSLMRDNTTHMQFAVGAELDSLANRYRGRYPQDIVATGITNKLIMRVARECPAFMELMQAQLIKTVHQMYALEEDQAALLDELALAACPCALRDEDCVRQIIKGREAAALALFPEQKGKSATDQLLLLITTWRAVGCP